MIDQRTGNRPLFFFLLPFNSPMVRGGVGKTTTSQALTAGLVAKGYKVMGVDLDTQGNFSSACGFVNYNVLTASQLPTT